MPKVSAKGQISIPQVYREKYGLGFGSEIDFKEVNEMLVIMPKRKKTAPLKKEPDLLEMVRNAGVKPSKITDEEIEQLKHERRMRHA